MKIGDLLVASNPFTAIVLAVVVGAGLFGALALGSSGARAQSQPSTTPAPTATATETLTDPQEDPAEVQIRIADGNLSDESPTHVVPPSVALNVAENTPRSTVLANYAGIFPGVIAGSLTYWLTGANASSFEIMPNGDLVTLESIDSDSETPCPGNICQITVNANDGAQTLTADVRITVIDVEDSISTLDARKANPVPGPNAGIADSALSGAKTTRNVAVPERPADLPATITSYDLDNDGTPDNVTDAVNFVETERANWGTVLLIEVTAESPDADCGNGNQCVVFHLNSDSAGDAISVIAYRSAHQENKFLAAVKLVGRSASAGDGENDPAYLLPTEHRAPGGIRPRDMGATPGDSPVYKHSTLGPEGETLVPRIQVDEEDLIRIAFQNLRHSVDVENTPPKIEAFAPVHESAFHAVYVKYTFRITDGLSGIPEPDDLPDNDGDQDYMPVIAVVSGTQCARPEVDIGNNRTIRADAAQCNNMRGTHRYYAGMAAKDEWGYIAVREDRDFDDIDYGYEVETTLVLDDDKSFYVTFVVVDRAGNMAYYDADPSNDDVEYAEIVIDTTATPTETPMPTPTSVPPTADPVVAGPTIVVETAIPDDWHIEQADEVISVFEAFADGDVTFAMLETSDSANFLLVPAGMSDEGNHRAHLLLKEGVTLDREIQDTFSVTVLAIGESGASTEVLLRIRIAESDSAPRTPTPTPTATPVPLGDCGIMIEGRVNQVGVWADDCLSMNRPRGNTPGSGDYYARYFAFILDEPATVSISLTSEVDTYLYLMRGVGSNGEIVAENDDALVRVDTNSSIHEQLSAGEYTIEATTYDKEEAGRFRLVVSGLPGAGEEPDCLTGGAVHDPSTNVRLVVDCEALLSARDALAGNATLNWSAVLPIEQWTGVTVDGADGSPKRITRLELNSAGLNGRIPSDLVALSSLETLSLNDNRLRGEIPARLSSLVALTELSLAKNELTGSIPTALGDMSALTTLRLNGNSLSGAIPAELGNLTNLRALSLADNRLNGAIPIELAELFNLEYLKLSGDNHRFSGCIPAALQDVADNDMATVGLEFCASGICTTGSAVVNPEDNAMLVSDCNALLSMKRMLEGRASPLNWSVNTPIGDWEGIGVSSSSPKRVVTLALGNRALSGRMPAELGSLTGLTLLHIPGNELSGAIPAELGNLKNLSILLLADNNLSGAIPAELDDLANLSFMSLANNNLSGDIPPELSSLTNLNTMNLNDNRLNGAIPRELGSLPKLKNLNISDNDLSESIPPELGDIYSLERLELAGNELTGKIPAELGSLSSLKVLDLSSNNLEDEIPSELGSLSNLETLELSANRLTGEIPAQLGALPNMRRLSLHSNQFTGCIPKELQDVRANDLSSLRLPFCGEGKCAGGTAVPNPNANHGLVADCHALISARDMLKGNAALNWSPGLAMSGWEGVVIGNSPGRVVELNLSGKELDGKISPDLANITHLKTLDLSDNELTDAIPSELAKLARLEKLLLTNNRLIGQIPHDLTRLANLKELKVSSNSLTGCIPVGLEEGVADDDLASLRLLACDKVDCSTGTAVEAPSDNAELVQDCKTLLGLRDTLAGSAFLNWSVHRDINSWDGIKTGGSTAKRVTHIELAAGALNGEIPPAFGRLAGLQVLDLSDNALSGRIPSELHRLANLQKLLLANNKLIGIISPELAVLTLTEIKLAGNSLTGCIPSKFMQVPTNDLDKLMLQDCTASACSGGTAVESPQANPGLMADCDALLSARDILTASRFLNWNKDVAIETWDGVTVSGSPKRVTALSIGRNRLRGELSPELGKLYKLERLLLSNNRLTGDIPPELGDLFNLTHLSLADNSLTGAIPSELSALANLEYLYLSGNRLTGCIPAGLPNVARNDLSRLGLSACQP